MSYRTGCVTIFGIFKAPDWRFIVMNTNFLDIRVNVNMYTLHATISMPESGCTNTLEKDIRYEADTYFLF